jgi:hypothetical protein
MHTVGAREGEAPPSRVERLRIGDPTTDCRGNISDRFIMIRRLLNLLTVVSLLLCVAVAVLWVSSHGRKRPFIVDGYPTSGNYWMFVSHNGYFRVENWRRPDNVIRQNLSARRERLEADLKELRRLQRERERERHREGPRTPFAPGDWRGVSEEEQELIRKLVGISSIR